MLLTPSWRVGLVNFLIDGTLSTRITDSLIDAHNEMDNRSLNEFRRDTYGNALRIAYTRLQIMQREGTTLRAETISSIQSGLEKYKANGGGSEFDNINEFLISKP